jgi:hypothetical protein
MDWILDLLTRLGTTRIYSAIADYTLCKSLAHAKSSQFSLVVSWQRFYKSLPVATAHIEYCFNMLNLLFIDWFSTDNWTEPKSHWIVIYFYLFVILPLVGPQHRKHIRCLAMDIRQSHRKNILRHLFYCCVRILSPLPRNGSILLLVLYLLRASLLRPFLSNWSPFHNIFSPWELRNTRISCLLRNSKRSRTWLSGSLYQEFIRFA